MFSKTKRKVNNKETKTSCLLLFNNSNKTTRKGIIEIKKKLPVIEIRKIIIREKRELKITDATSLFLISFFIVTAFAARVPIFMFR